jgi:putative transposase
MAEVFKTCADVELIDKAIEENPRESRKEWMLWLFERAAKKNSNNGKYRFWQDKL